MGVKNHRIACTECLAHMISLVYNIQLTLKQSYFIHRKCHSVQIQCPFFLDLDSHQIFLLLEIPTAEYPVPNYPLKAWIWLYHPLIKTPQWLFIFSKLISLWPNSLIRLMSPLLSSSHTFNNLKLTCSYPNVQYCI